MAAAHRRFWVETAHIAKIGTHLQATVQNSNGGQQFRLQEENTMVMLACGDKRPVIPALDSFFTGGANNEQGMLRLNISDPDNVSWTNQTKGNGLSGVDVDVIAGGMVFLPIGLSGVLLLTGGTDVRPRDFHLRLVY